MRLSRFYLAIATFAVGEMLIMIWLNTDYLGGAIGFIGIPLESDWKVVLAVVLFTLFVVWRIEQSRFGPAFRAVRDNQVVAGPMGVDVKRTKLLAWLVGGFITGIGGCLHAYRVTVLSPQEFGFYFSLTILLAVLIGGLRTFWGTCLGTSGRAVVTTSPAISRRAKAPTSRHTGSATRKPADGGSVGAVGRRRGHRRQAVGGQLLVGFGRAFLGRDLGIG